MKNLILQAKYWIYSLSFGPNQPLRPSTWRLTSGSDSGRRFCESLMNLHQTMSRWVANTWTTTTQQWSSTWASRPRYFHQYPGRHRATGGLRQTRAGESEIRFQREEAWANHKAFLDLRDPSTVGVAYFGPPVLAYRGLSAAVLNRETRELVRRYAPTGWLDD